MDKIPERFFDRKLWITWAALFAYSWLVLYSLFLNGKFAYHDLSFLSEVFSNTAYGRGFFYVSEYGFSHFKFHFTPSLLLLVPLYRIFESQFVLLATGTIAFFVSTLLYLKIAQGIFRRCPIDVPQSLAQGWFRWVPLAFFLLVATNRYTKNVLTAAHYEIFYLLFWALLIWCLLENKSIIGLILSWFLTVGLRSDASFYLFFQLLALRFLPAWIAVNRARFLKLHALLCTLTLVYFILLMKVINPILGATDQVLRWWGHLGATHREIMFTILTSPGLVLREVAHSGFLSLNLTFLFIPLLQPMNFILNNIPAIPVYLLHVPERKQMFYYHSGVLLPGLFLGCIVGICFLLKMAAQAENTPGAPAWRRWFPKFFLLAIFPIQILTFTHTNNGFRFRPYFETQSAFRAELKDQILKCPLADTIAIDFKDTVFLPNSKRTCLLRDFAKAQLIVIRRNGDPLLSGSPTLEAFEAQLKESGKYQIREKGTEANYYIPNGFVCTSAN